MKLFKNIMSRKPDPEETVSKLDLEMDLEPLRRRSDLLADDTGQPNRAARPRSEDPLFGDPSKPSYNRSEEPEEVAGAGWGANAWSSDDDDWDDDEDWGDDDFEEIDDRGMTASGREVSQSNRWAEDEEFGRKAIARSQLGAGGPSEDRILEKTNSKMVDRESSRRHSAMAHLKAAAAATKADRVLKDVASRDPASDPEEQSLYRDDLAKVVRPRPTTRPTTQPRSITPPWQTDEVNAAAMRFANEAEQGFSAQDDEDDSYDDDDGFVDGSERFADDPTERFSSGEDRFATDQSAFESIDDEDMEEDLEEIEVAGAPRAAHIPDDLSEDDFTDGGPDFAANVGDRFGIEGTDEAAAEMAFDDDDDDEDEDAAFEVPDFPIAQAQEADDDEDELAASYEDEDDLKAYDEDEDGPVASTAVSEAIALANAPDEEEEIDADEVRRKIWDISGDTPLVRDPAEQRFAEPKATAPAAAEATPSREKAPEPEAIVNLASAGPAVAGRAGRSAGRVKTRLLGFQDPQDTSADVFDAAKPAATASQAKYPVGWIIVIDGPGHGSCFTLFNGVGQIGRGEDQAIRLDFGDTSISRNNHAAVAYDDEQSKFFLGHGGKSNLVRLNGRPVLSTEELSHGDAIRIGETTLKFIALCGDDFSWKHTDGEDADNGANA